MSLSGFRRILILTSGPLCRNPRVLKEATALGTAGFDVTVMTVATQARFERYDEDILRTAPFRKRALDLVATDSGARCRAFRARLGTWLAQRTIRLGVQSPLAFGPYLQLRQMSAAFPADLFIVHTEIAFCIGCDLLRRGRRVAADFEDWHSRDLLPSAQAGRPLALLDRVERELLHRAAYVSTTSHALAAALQSSAGSATRPVVLTNSFPLQPVPAFAPRSGPPDFFWFSQTIGPGRGLEPFLAAWLHTKHPSRLHLLGDVDDTYRQKLIQRLPAERRHQLDFLPLVSPAELPKVIARHDLGLALEASIPQSRDLTITNKVLQYLNAGLGIIASDTAGQREVLTCAPAAGHIVALGDTSALAAMLETLMADRSRIAEMGRAARRAAEEIYCWEKESPRLIAAVEGAVAMSAPHTT